MNIKNSAVTGNMATFAGGGLSNSGSGTMTLINSTVSGNHSVFAGGIVNFDQARLILANCTVNGNVAANGGGGIYIEADYPVTLTNSIFSENDPENCQTSEAITSNGYNIDSDGTCLQNSTTGDLIGVDPMLGPLQSNGGTTATHALLPSSAATDAIPDEACIDPDGNPLTTDQRGVSRPQGSACDIGAYEYVPVIEGISFFFDQSVTDGSLTGDGPGKSANGRLNAQRNKLEMASDLIAIDDIEGACGQLKAASRKCDGKRKPPDFVAGPAVPELYEMIVELMAELGCE